MSTTASALSGFNFTGGLPTNVDFAPSIVFIVLYAALIPLAAFRVIRYEHRCLPLIRPIIFIGARLGYFIVRILLIKKGIQQGTLTAELILILVGYVFLVEPAVDLWKRHVATIIYQEHGRVPYQKSQSGGQRRGGGGLIFGMVGKIASGEIHWLEVVANVLRLLLLAAIIVGIVAGSSISGAINDPSKLSSIQSTRRISYILSFVVAAVLFVGNIITAFKYPVDRKASVYLFGVTAGLVVIGAYRLAQGYASAGAPVTTKAAFYVLEIVIEWLITVAFLSISIPAWFPKFKPTTNDLTEKSNNSALGAREYSNEPIYAGNGRTGAQGV